MKKVIVVKSVKVEIKPFKLEDFTQDKETPASMNKVTKKRLKKLADGLALDYDDAGITLSKKLLKVYLAKR